MNDARLKTYLMDELELEVVINDKRYKDETACPVVILTTDENNEKQ